MKRNSAKNKRDNLNIVRAKIFKALADPLRLKILYYLRDGEKCVSEMLPHLQTVQPLVSRHLRVLRSYGIVSFRREGNRKPYSITDKRILEIIDMVETDLISALSKYSEGELNTR